MTLAERALLDGVTASTPTLAAAVRAAIDDPAVEAWGKPGIPDAETVEIPAARWRAIADALRGVPAATGALCPTCGAYTGTDAVLGGCGRRGGEAEGLRARLAIRREPSGAYTLRRSEGGGDYTETHGLSLDAAFAALDAIRGGAK